MRGSGSVRAGRLGITGALAVVVAACSTSTSSSAPPTTAPTAADRSTTTIVSSSTSTTIAASTTIASSAPSTSITTTVTTVRTRTRSGIECVAEVPVEVRAAQVLMPAVLGDQLRPANEIIDELNVGGALLLTWPDGADPAELQTLRRPRPEALGVLIAVDEEGGVVQRLRSLGELSAPRDVAASMSPDEARDLIAEHAAQVADLGIDVVFAPVVDVAPADASGGPIGSRAFSDDPDVVAEYAAAYVDGWESAGVTPVLKHFPGHGSASADTHDGGATTPPLEQLRERDLVPYIAMADRASDVGVMVGHLDVPGLTDELPTSMSSAAITGLLRGELGFADTLVFTDALGMGAVAQTHDVPEAAVESLRAGADMIVYEDIADTEDVIAAIAAAVSDGSLDSARLDEAVMRVYDDKGITFTC